MKMYHYSDADSCGLSKVVQNCVIYSLLVRTNAMVSNKNFNSSDPVNTRRNVSLKFALIAFWACTKMAQHLTLHYREQCYYVSLNSAPEFFFLIQNHAGQI